MSCPLCKGAPVLFPGATDCVMCQLRSPEGHARITAYHARVEVLVAEREARRRRVALVGCGAAKRPGTHPARDLYTSTLFRLSVAFAEDQAAYIVSAKHGLLELAQPVASYEYRLHRCEERAWGERVAARLEALYPDDPLDVVALAGKQYVNAIRAALRPSWTILEPLAGLTVGHRLAWLRREVLLPRRAFA